MPNIEIMNSHISGVNTITATSFIGDGSQLTGITLGAVTGLIDKIENLETTINSLISRIEALENP